jgi:outer membrane lipoprotein SlyB
MVKYILALLLALTLTGCANYDWAFNKGHERAQVVENLNG